MQIDVKAFLTDGKTVATASFEVIFEDPRVICKDAVLAIESTVFKDLPELSLVYTIGSSEESVIWDSSIAKTSVPFGVDDPCLPFGFEVSETETGAIPDPSIFIVDLASQSAMMLSTLINIPIARAGLYNLTISAYYEDYRADTLVSKAFAVELVNPCLTAIQIDNSIFKSPPESSLELLTDEF